MIPLDRKAVREKLFVGDQAHPELKHNGHLLGVLTKLKHGMLGMAFDVRVTLSISN